MSNELTVTALYDRADENRIDTFTKKAKSDMIVDLHYDKVDANFEWVDLFEDTMRYIDNILRNPNRFIINEEEIVKVELAKRVTVDSIKHLSKHTNLIQDINEKEEITPSKILNINKEENFDTYENRFVYTLIQNMESFISVKKKYLMSEVEHYVTISPFSKTSMKINYQHFSSVQSLSHVRLLQTHVL